MEDISVDFVLTRGPEAVCRRLRVAVPADGTPVTIGRALHCGAVLDPWLVFASQVQCSLFCVPETATTGGDATLQQTSPSPSSSSSGAAASSSPQREKEQPQHEGEREVVVVADTTPDRRTLSSTATPATRPAAVQRLFLTDMCSSNGTFLNGIRVGSTDAVPLSDGDACVFGGMRDVAIGAALPEDAFAGPELVVWRVDVASGEKAQPTQYPYEATPALLPTSETLHREEREVLSTALRSLRKPLSGGDAVGGASAATHTPSPAARNSTHAPCNSGSDCCGGAAGNDRHDGATPASPDVLQQLFTGDTPATEARRPDRTDPAEEEGVEGEGMEGHDAMPSTHSDADDGNDEEEEKADRRSGTVATRLPSPTATAPSVPSPAEEEEGPDGGSGSNDFFLLLSTLESPATTLASNPPPSPPAAAHFHALRLGRHTFHAPVASLLGAYVARVEDIREEAGAEEGEEEEEEEEASTSTLRGNKKGAKRGRKNAKPSTSTALKKPRTEADAQADVIAQVRQLPPPPFSIHFTDAHWKWVMGSPNHSTVTAAAAPLPIGLATIAATAAAPPAAAFHAMLPVTAIQSILVCRDRLGLSVELRDGCTVPLVRLGVLDGAAENRWIVWMLEDCQVGGREVGGEMTVSSSGATATAATTVKAPRRRSHRSAEKKQQPEWDGLAAATTATSLHDHFDEWVAGLAAFYGALKVPAPLAVDADTFDKLFSPERVME